MIGIHKDFDSLDCWTDSQGSSEYLDSKVILERWEQTQQAYCGESLL